MALCGGSGPPARGQCGPERLGRGLEGAEASGRHGGPAAVGADRWLLSAWVCDSCFRNKRSPSASTSPRAAAQRYLSSVSERRSNVKGRPDLKARGVDWPRTGAPGWFSVVCDLTDLGERRAYILGPAEAILTRSDYCNKRTADVSAREARHTTYI